MNTAIKKPLLCICIPTYNRAVFLKNLLDAVLPQVKVLQGLVQVCVSDNASTDTTGEVLAEFSQKYPGLITCNQNKENLGLDKNIIKVMEMATGDFTWMAGDDDMIVGGGVSKVVNFIQESTDENTGLVIVGHQDYCCDALTGKKMVYYDGISKSEPKAYPMDIKDIVGMRMSSAFLSVLIFNTAYLKKTLQEEKNIIAKAIGKHYIHTVLYQLMFFGNPALGVLKYNEKIVESDVHYYKFYVEDFFELYYTARVMLSDLLLGKEGLDAKYKKVLVAQKRKLKRGFIRQMMAARAFGKLHCASFWGCIGLFFAKTGVLTAVLFSFSFIIFSLAPPVVLKGLYRLFVRLKYKNEWRQIWLGIVITYQEMSKGERRLIS